MVEIGTWWRLVHGAIHCNFFSCVDSVELKQKLAEQWNKVLLARDRVRLTRKACDASGKLTKKGKGEGLKGREMGERGAERKGRRGRREREGGRREKRIRRLSRKTHPTYLSAHISSN